MKTYLVYVTVADETQADLIARTAVSERLAASVNMLGAVRSIFRWGDRIQEESEVAVLLKTTEARKDALCERVKQLHSYKCPCILALLVDGGNSEFLKWIESETVVPRS